MTELKNKITTKFEAKDRFCDILIIGGGFSGLTAALSLAKNNPNLKIALLEKNDLINSSRPNDGRVFAISKNSLNLFNQIGIWPKLEQFAGKINQIKISEGNSPFYLNFDSSPDQARHCEEQFIATKQSTESDENRDYMGIVIENFRIHNALRDAILQQQNIKILSPNFYQKIEFNENYALTTLNGGQVIKSKLLIAADGKNSPLREIFNIRIFTKSYQQSAIVFNISHQNPHNNIAIENFLANGPLAILPMQNQYSSTVIWTVAENIAEVILGLDEENFLAQFNKNSTADHLGEIKLISKIFSHNLNLILAQNYFYERTILLGDAAHAIHPIAGQGFNLGISDIIHLTKLVKEYSETGLDIGSKILLSNYQFNRKIATRKMVLATDMLNDLFAIQFLPIRIARQFGLMLTEKLPQLKGFFIKNAGGN